MAETGRSITLFNSLGRRLEEFVPSEPGKVGIYSCGLTVYAYPHVGNMRAYLFTDTLHRLFEWKGYDIRHIINVTDVGHMTSDADEGDDKMAVAARREQRTMQEVAEYYTGIFLGDLARLRVIPADVFPRASHHVAEMIEFTTALERGGFTYQIGDGLYFDTSLSQGYGRLGLLDLEGMREGARVEAAEGKRNKADFAVWRSRRGDEERAMEWPSPWGPGAPGWHLECSVMSMKYLGPHFDIHTGGVDHREVHHVNEIAQSEAYLGDGQRWVRYWLHNDFVVFADGKMSKSLGRTIRLQDLVDRGLHPAVFRHVVVSAHYRSKLTFSWDALEASEASLRRLLLRTEGRRGDRRRFDGLLTFADALAAVRSAAARRYLEEIDEAISADLNTALCLAAVERFVRDPEIDEGDLHVLLAAGETVLGLGLLDLCAEDLAARGELGEAERSQVEELVRARSEARAAGRWQEADELRDRLKAMGIALSDSPAGTEWAVVPHQD